MKSSLDENFFLPSNSQKETWLKKHQQTAQKNFDLIRKKLSFSNARLHWINHSFSISVDLKQLQQLSQSPLVKKIYFQKEASPLVAPPKSEASPIEKSPPYHLLATQMHQVREKYPHLTGKGITIGAIDSGVDASHPWLMGKVTKFFNGDLGQTTKPKDFGQHGTHVSGILVGQNSQDPKQSPLGLAPHADLIMAGALIQARITPILEAMQFLLDPDGDPATNDAPRVINNSFSTQIANDQEPFYRAISAWEAAGITMVFSAGNLGPKEATITSPKEHPATITVGATQEDGNIYPRSSRGPATYKGVTVLKPDLVAPGRNIFSTLPRGRFAKRSGTSMAAPQVTATIALMLQANPSLRPHLIKNILIQTATSSDENGFSSTKNWNPTFGHGKLNSLAAIEKAISLAQRQPLPVMVFLDWFMPTEIRLPLFQDSSADLPTESLPQHTPFVESPTKKWLTPEEFFSGAQLTAPPKIPQRSFHALSPHHDKSQ